MKTIFTKIFKKSNKEKIPASGFGTTLEEDTPKRKEYVWPKKRDIIVKTDVAFHKPASKLIDEIKSKFKDTDYNNLEFEEEIEDFNLKALSPEAKNLIIQIIKEDNKNRIPKIETYTDSKIYPEILVPTDLSKLPTRYGINPKTKQVDIFDEDTKDTLMTFTEYGEILKKEEGEKNLKNKEELLYRLVSTYFPGNTHEENIEFIKQNLKLDEVTN